MFASRLLPDAASGRLAKPKTKTRSKTKAETKIEAKLRQD